MPYQTAVFTCPRCQTPTQFQRNAPNHILHLLVSLFCCAPWVLVWIAVVLTTDPFRCTNCGARKARSLGEWLMLVFGLVAVMSIGVFVVMVVVGAMTAPDAPPITPTTTPPTTLTPQTTLTAPPPPTVKKPTIGTTTQHAPPPQKPEPATVKPAKTKAADDTARTERQQRDDDEKAADALLTLARDLARGGKIDAAKTRLTKILEEYPNTPAAKEARKILTQIDK